MPVLSIDRDGVQFKNTNGELRRLAADRILFAADPSPDAGLAEAFKTLAPEVKVIGDCAGFGLVKKAIKDATFAAYAL